MSIANKPHVTYEMLEKFLAAPGQIDIHIHHLQGHYVPFVFFAPAGHEQTGYGPIIHADSVVAAEDADELVEELREKLGAAPNIIKAGRSAAQLRPH